MKVRGVKTYTFELPPVKIAIECDSEGFEGGLEALREDVRIALFESIDASMIDGVGWVSTSIDLQ